MKWIERILLIPIFIGILFKLRHYPGSGVLLILGLGFLAAFYQFFSFLILNGISGRKIFKAESYKETSAFRLIGSICAGFVFSTALLGILFKIQLYPGASVMVYSSVIGLSIMGATLIFFSLKGRNNFINDNYLRIAPIVFLTFFFYSITNVDIVEFYYGDTHPEYVDAHREFQENPNDPNAERNLDVAREKMYYEMNNSSKRDRE